MKGCILALLAEEQSEHQCAFMFTISQITVQKSITMHKLIKKYKVKTTAIGDIDADWQMTKLLQHDTTCLTKRMANGIRGQVYSKAGLKQAPLAGAEVMQSQEKMPFINEKQRGAKLWFAKGNKNWIVKNWGKVNFSNELNFLAFCIT